MVMRNTHLVYTLLGQMVALEIALGNSIPTSVLAQFPHATYETLYKTAEFKLYLICVHLSADFWIQTSNFEAIKKLLFESLVTTNFEHFNRS